MEDREYRTYAALRHFDSNLADAVMKTPQGNDQFERSVILIQAWVRGNEGRKAYLDLLIAHAEQQQEVDRVKREMFLSESSVLLDAVQRERRMSDAQLIQKSRRHRQIRAAGLIQSWFRLSQKKAGVRWGERQTNTLMPGGWSFPQNCDQPPTPVCSPKHIDTYSTSPQSFRVLQQKKNNQDHKKDSSVTSLTSPQRVKMVLGDMGAVIAENVQPEETLTHAHISPKSFKSVDDLDSLYNLPPSPGSQSSLRMHSRSPSPHKMTNSLLYTLSPPSPPAGSVTSDFFELSDISGDSDHEKD